MWWISLRVKENKLPEVIDIIQKRFFLSTIHKIAKEDVNNYIIEFGTSSTLEEILRIFREANLYYYLIAIERGA